MKSYQTTLQKERNRILYDKDLIFTTGISCSGRGEGGAGQHGLSLHLTNNTEIVAISEELGTGTIPASLNMSRKVLVCTHMSMKLCMHFHG